MEEAQNKNTRVSKWLPKMALLRLGRLSLGFSCLGFLCWLYAGFGIYGLFLIPFAFLSSLIGFLGGLAALRTSPGQLSSSIAVLTVAGAWLFAPFFGEASKSVLIFSWTFDIELLIWVCFLVMVCVNASRNYRRSQQQNRTRQVKEVYYGEWPPASVLPHLGSLSLRCSSWSLLCWILFYATYTDGTQGATLDNEVLFFVTLILFPTAFLLSLCGLMVGFAALGDPVAQTGTGIALLSLTSIALVWGWTPELVAHAPWSLQHHYYPWPLTLNLMLWLCFLILVCIVPLWRSHWKKLLKIGLTCLLAFLVLVSAAVEVIRVRQMSVEIATAEHMTADAMNAAYEKDSRYAQHQYDQKIVVVTGTVSVDDPDGGLIGNLYPFVGHSGWFPNPPKMGSIEFDDLVFDDAVNEGQKVSIVGTCKGLDQYGTIRFSDCHVINRFKN